MYGKFSKEFRNGIPGGDKNPNFWAAGISVVMHMKNPHVPAMHFNTRYIYTSHGWFGIALIPNGLIPKSFPASISLSNM